MSLGEVCSLFMAVAQALLCVRDAEGAPKGRSRFAMRGETEGAFAPEPRSQPDPERGEGARPKINFE